MSDLLQWSTWWLQAGGHGATDPGHRAPVDRSAAFPHVYRQQTKRISLTDRQAPSVFECIYNNFDF